MSAGTRRGFLGHTAGAAVAAIATYFVSRPEPAAKPQIELRPGTAIMSIGGRTVLVDVNDFKPDGAEMVVLRHDGAIEILAPVRIGWGGSNPRSYMGPTEIVDTQGHFGAYGVHVIGRVIGERTTLA